MRATWILLLVACSDARSRGDASVDDVNESRDSTVDAPDEPTDASIDGPPDAYVAYLPECTTAPATFVDVSPREFGDMALSGHVLYASAYEQADTGDISNAVILSYDLMTGTEAYAPVTTAGDALLVAVGNDVYASISASGTILRLHPGSAPQTLVTGRPSAGAVTADATHLYWTERATPGDPDMVKRLPFAGGPVETGITCNGAAQLFIVGTDLFCFPFNGSPLKVAKDGTGQITSYSTTGYPGVSTVLEGSDFYVAGFSVYPQIQHLPLPNGPMTLVHEGTTFGRFSGIAATSTHLYVTEMDVGIRRFRRSNMTSTLIAPDYSRVGDPVIWNNRLYYTTGSFTDADHHRLRICVD